jgi:NodT family efflux transporter outer membrane factor (OMF) lipoprotein
MRSAVSAPAGRARPLNRLRRVNAPAAWRLAASAALAVLSIGCADTGGLRPTHQLTDPSSLGAATLRTDAAPTASAPTWPNERWWERFGDRALSQLIDQALQQQPALKQAQARVQQAAALAGAAAAAGQPQVQLAADLSDQRFTEKGLVPPPLAGTTHWNNSVQLNGSWELDLFGRQRAALDAAIGRQRAAEADAQAARVLLASQIASHWFALARQLALQSLAERSLEQRQQVLALVRQRLDAGLDTAVERHQAEGLIAQSQVDLEALTATIARERHALAELAGQGPQALAALSPQLAPLQAQPLPAVLGADLVGRRADLVALRWRVEAALHDVDNARAQFYPNINLVAFAGLSSLGLDQLLNAGARTYGIGPALRLPVFEGGRLRSQLAARSAEADAAMEGWNTTLLRALREVADEASTLQALDRQQAAQLRATDAAERAFDLALQRYRAGLGNFLSVLTADGTALAQRRAAAELKARHLAAEVALTQALGGGYHSPAVPETGPMAHARP